MPSARELAEAAVRLARAAGYYNAGTVEFLVDADTGEWYFIEVNPRIQVEHTVTEMVTGIDLVRCQILVAQGLTLHGPEIDLPPQERDSALRLRAAVPHHHGGSREQFVPDYGKIHTYRSPAGFGIRLDGGSAYGGAVITPYYDSLLVKITAWGREFPQACQRMDRALREFRVRGVKTNIPFLENVVNHPDFQAGRVTTRFLDETPALFRFTPRKRSRHEAAHLPGRRDRQRQSRGGRQAAARSASTRRRFRAHDTRPRRRTGTRQLLDELGPEKFAEWTRIAEAPAAHRHHVPRRAPIAAGHARAHLRHAAHRQFRGAPAAQSVQPGNVGRRDFRRRHALPARRPWKRLRRLREADSEHLFPDAAARLERGRLYRVSG